MIKVKDGYGKLIGSEYKGSADQVLLSDGSNLGYAIPSTGNTLVLRNTSGQIESSLTTDSNLSPFVVTSTVVNTNLNSDLLDGFHAGGLFQTLSSSTSVNLTVKIGNTEKKIEKLYATYDSLGNTIAAKYVTLDTAQTISGVKTFSSQQKFTVSSVSPFTVNSNVVVTNLNADLLDGTHKADLFTDFSNITSGTDVNKVSITIGGTTKKIIINYAQNAGSIGGITADGLFTALTSTPAKNLSITIGGTTKDITSLYSNYWVPQAIGSKDFNTMYGDTYRGTSWYGGGSNTATNNPLGSGQAFGMQVWRNADGYTAQLIMSSNGKLYIRYYNGSTWSELKQFAFTTDAGQGGGYWANLAVQATADSGTKPTFAEATVTTQVTTPRVRSTGRLTLNAASTALDLKFANDDTKSVILNGTGFKPFDSANGNLDLGASDARWKGLYAGTGDFTGIVRTTGDGFYLASTSTYPRSRWTYTSDGIWLQAANWDGNSVKGTLWITGHNANNLTKLNIKSDNTNYNGTLSITSDGKIAATNTGSRQAGMYGIYDSTKVGHIWSMGTSFAINANGSNTGNLYGLAYFHTNWSNASAKNDGSKTEVSPYAGNHQAAWVVNGKVCAALGNYVWSRNGFIKHGSDDTYALTGGGGHKAIGNVQNTAFYKRETSVNGTVWNMAGTTNSAAFTIYAPTTAGTSGYLLKSNGSGAPTWVAPSSISIGDADTLDGRHACKSFASASAIDFTAIFWIASGAISDVSTMSYASLINVGNGPTRRWQIWNSRNDHQLYWRPEKADYSDYADVHILLDNYNFKNYVDDMYWANVKVSASSNTGTYPTFANMKSTGRVYLDEWIQFSGSSGLLWPNANGAHLQANTITSYAGLLTQGARNGYCGLHCGPNTNYMTVMSTDIHHGLYCENTRQWEFYYNRANKQAGILTSSLTSGHALTVGGNISVVYNSYPGLTIHNNTTSGESSIYVKNNTAGWALGVNTWGLGAGQFAIGQYSGTGSSSWRFRIDNNGYCYTNSYLNLGGGHEKNASSPTYVWGSNSSDTFLRSYQTSKLSVNYANSAGTSSNVVVNNSNANSTYRMVWHSGNTLFSTNNIYCNPSTDQIYSAGFRHVSYNSASYLLRSDGGAAAFNWSGQSGQPTWLWGGNSQHTYYVYNPSNFNVNSAAKLRVVSCYNGTINNDLWSTIKSSNSSYLGTSTMYEVYNDGGPTTYGHVLDTVTVHSNHWQSQLWMAAGKGGRLYYRNKDYNNDTWGDWRTVAWTSDIPSVGNGTIIINQGGSEKGRFTVNQSGTTTINLTDSNTNTWRDVENVLTSISTSNSLTANMGRVLANGAGDRPIVLLAGTLYRNGAGSSYTTWYFTGYRHRSISSSSPSVYINGGVARFQFTNSFGYGFSFAQVCANHQASGEATGYQSGEYQTRSSGLFWFGTYATGQYLYIRAIAQSNEHNDTAESYEGMWTSYSDGVTRVSIIAVGYAW